MSPSHVLEPTYAAIKNGLVTASWPAGMRLESARIAEDLGVSITPVRDSLNRLVGERLAEFTPGDGFRVPLRSEQDLRDMFELNLSLLRLALPAGTVGKATSPEAGIVDLAARIDASFERLASRSGNGEVQASIRSLNDRLHATRRIDALVDANATVEAGNLEQLARASAPADELISALELYHRARIDRAAVYIRHLSPGLGRVEIR